MKVAILAGGYGTRLAEETAARPKPMVEIGGKPILWHIMNIYAAHGFNDFVIACGYRGEMIKDYFRHLFFREADLMINLLDGTYRTLSANTPDWKIAAVDTGLDTMTGGRLLRLRRWLEDDAFMVTYGDGVGDVDVGALLDFHRAHGKLATVTAVRPPARFGGLVFDGDRVAEFSEKPQATAGWINGGFFVFEPGALDYMDGDATILERGPLERLARDGQLMAYRHEGFWQPMDTVRERQLLEELWASGKAPWKVWETNAPRPE
ncbi:MAG TPA: glucose-1-phosphate cytidylyltransferase, partial [Longimicrobium sp.]|nr:glucose-1-phosphate cytidylyltransferase [Longimicrobium sp.]